jgi:hypothetical protein
VCITGGKNGLAGPVLGDKFLAPPGLSFRLYLFVPAGQSAERSRSVLGWFPAGLPGDCGEEPDIRERGEVWAEL